MPQAKAFADQISQNEQLKASAREEHAALSLKLVENPTDKSIFDDLDAIENEIVGYDRSNDRLRAAQAEAARRDSKEARRARFELLKTQRARIAQSNTETEALAKKLERALDAIGPLLAQWQLHTEDRSADVRSIMVGTAGSGANALKGDSNAADSITRLETGEIIEALARLVVATGLARTGPRLDPFVVIAGPSSMSRKMSLCEAVGAANKKLLSAVDARVERGATLLLGESNE